ncbi:GDSL-type esterase/lipase family protein [Corynebacterium aquatimens]|uniref:SGNH hydrolase-type esterase domain-containing protein n=1 Tax=Corynebacterium aquatimens TaxID=1190508 RepID=A0A931E3H4_9CORY|nr:GDSL-type esterase/lipase family protein [Corynebacterium aquatimens]MBG6122501.1 hypothetical protein [Corynebacterium aquatimens]WJY64959.1 hypothetical protein CAQUA_01100 [Corynebacterium aquatimens]
MTIKSRRVAVAVTAILAAIGMAIAPHAEAQRGNMVMFGDSIMNDAPALEVAGARFGVHPNGKADPNRWCPRSNENFGVLTARKLGLQPRDFSCSGAVAISPGPKFQDQVNHALRVRALDKNTRRVLIQAGFNDTYNHAGRDPMAVRRDFVNALRPTIDQIRRAAPNARIQIIGYPSITSRGDICAIHVIPNLADRIPMPQVAAWENLAQWMEVDLARATGVQFVDLKPATRINNMCAPDNARMFAGLIDLTAGPGHMPIHINQRGHEHISNVIARS